MRNFPESPQNKIEVERSIMSLIEGSSHILSQTSGSLLNTTDHKMSAYSNQLGSLNNDKLSGGKIQYISDNDFQRINKLKKKNV